MQNFRPLNPLMAGLARVADLLLLNLLALLCCLPIVTIGASLTGMHYVLHRMARKEEGYLVRDFCKSFRENLRQATGLWAIFLLFGLVFVADMQLTGPGGSLRLPQALRILMAAGGGIAFFAFLYAFPLLARFENTVRGTLGNALRLAFLALPRTVGMAAATLALPALCAICPVFLPLWIVLGLSGPGYACACLYSPVFRGLEEAIRHGA